MSAKSPQTPVEHRYFVVLFVFVLLALRRSFAICCISRIKAVLIEKKQIEPDITVVELTGKLLLGRESQRLEWIIDDLLAQNAKKVILDLTNMEYVDSAGLGILVSCAGKTKASGGSLRMVVVNERVLQLLRITSLDTILALYPTLAAACE